MSHFIIVHMCAESVHCVELTASVPGAPSALAQAQAVRKGRVQQCTGRMCIAFWEVHCIFATIVFGCTMYIDSAGPCSSDFMPRICSTDPRSSRPCVASTKARWQSCVWFSIKSDCQCILDQHCYFHPAIHGNASVLPHHGPCH